MHGGSPSATAGEMMDDMLGGSVRARAKDAGMSNSAGYIRAGYSPILLRRARRTQVCAVNCALTLLRRILAASAVLEARVLVTFGPSLEPGQFDAPPNARIERFIPHSPVLPHAAVMVTQCGLGSVAMRVASPVARAVSPVRRGESCGCKVQRPRLRVLRCCIFLRIYSPVGNIGDTRGLEE
jgi:hypothetical protein